MTPHIRAEHGQIAETVLMPGDPLRAKWAAETFLDSSELVNDVRGMLGFTGMWRGNRVTIHGSGLEHEDGDRAVLAQPVGQHAARRPGPDDDIVIAAHRATVGNLHRPRNRKTVATRYFVPGRESCRNWTQRSGLS